MQSAFFNSQYVSGEFFPQDDLLVIAVVATIPANLATNILINSKVYAIFNRSPNPATVNGSTFTLYQGINPVVGVVAVVTGAVISFTPSAPLAYDTVYTATITTGIQDTIGNSLASNHIWTFTTESPDMVPV